MSAQQELEYLTTAQVGERLGIKPKSVRQMLWRGLMPEPDLILMRHPLWLTDTIEHWQAAKHKRKKRRIRRRAALRAERLQTVPTSTVPTRARIARPEDLSTPLPAATVSAEIAREIAAALRHDGFHCTVRDVQELLLAGERELDYERRKLRQRATRKLRALGH